MKTTELLFSEEDQTRQRDPADSPPSAFEKRVALLLEGLFSKDEIDLKTELNDKQILALTRGRLFAQHYGCRLMTDFCDIHNMLYVSKTRGGRKEIVDMLRTITPTVGEETSRGIWSNLFSRGL